jgi:hypothetical protein
MRLTSTGLGLGTSSPDSYKDEAEQLVVAKAGNCGITIASASNGVGALYFADGTSGSDASRGGLYYSHIDNSMQLLADGSARVHIDSSGNVGIGTNPGLKLDVAATGDDGIRFATTGTNNSARLELSSGNGTASGKYAYIKVQNNDTNAQGYAFGTFGGDRWVIRDTKANSERLCVDTSGRLLVGTSTARASGLGSGISFLVEGAPDTINIGTVRNSNNASSAKLVLAKTRGSAVGSNTAVQSGDSLGMLEFDGADGTQLVCGASIEALVDATPGANDLPTRLVFSTTADGASSPTERMRITNGGDFYFNTTVSTKTVEGFRIENNGQPNVSRGADGTFMQFFHSGTGSLIGSIVNSGGTATAYNTSSDYRLKENVVPLTGAIDRLSDFQVRRFNFIADPDKTVDGFIAHEAQAVVPECVTGTKDEVDGNGDPVYQGIDQSKLVPLLTAALQEAIGRIETLEAEVTALKAS